MTTAREALLALAADLDREAASVRTEPSLARDRAIWSAAGYQNAAQLAREHAEKLPRVASGAALITTERHRQISDEGWTPDHDARHASGDLTRAACCYAMYATGVLNNGRVVWPWDPEDFKRAAPVRMLTKAGALIAAEIDRLLAAGGTE